MLGDHRGQATTPDAISLLASFFNQDLGLTVASANGLAIYLLRGITTGRAKKPSGDQSGTISRGSSRR